MYTLVSLGGHLGFPFLSPSLDDEHITLLLIETQTNYHVCYACDMGIRSRTTVPLPMDFNHRSKS